MAAQLSCVAVVISRLVSQAELGLMPWRYHYRIGMMSLSTYRWQHSFQRLQFETCVSQTAAQVCPLEDLFRTKPGLKSTRVRSVRPRKEPENTDLWQGYVQRGNLPHDADYTSKLPVEKWPSRTPPAGQITN